MSKIEELRKYDGYDGGVRDEVHEDIDSILGAYKPEGYVVKRVHSEFEEGGRWSNYETVVYEIKENGEVAYFEVFREFPASEMQEGMDLEFGFGEVEPKEVTVIKYVAKGSR